MRKWRVTEFFIQYFEENRIDKEWISEKTGIQVSKFSADYTKPLTAEEFFRLCVLLKIEPEEVWKAIKE